MDTNERKALFSGICTKLQELGWRNEGADSDDPDVVHFVRSTFPGFDGETSETIISIDPDGFAALDQFDGDFPTEHVDVTADLSAAIVEIVAWKSEVESLNARVRAALDDAK